MDSPQRMGRHMDSTEIPVYGEREHSADAAFAKPENYNALEERGVKYASRLPASDSLQRDIEEFLTRPVGRPQS